MRKKLVVLFLALGLLSFSVTAFAEDDFKGKSSPNEFDVGGMTGLGVVDSSAGLAIVGTISHKIIDRGFIPDINDAVAIEAQLGTVLFLGAGVFTYSAHLRWDFTQNADWTFYALGGLGGNITSVTLGSHFELFPRIGAGAFWKIAENFSLRAEVSHELIGVGAVIPF